MNCSVKKPRCIRDTSYTTYYSTSSFVDKREVHILINLYMHKNSSGAMHKKPRRPLGGGLGLEVEVDMLFPTYHFVLFINFCYHLHLILFLNTVFKLNIKNTYTFLEQILILICTQHSVSVVDSF